MNLILWLAQEIPGVEETVGVAETLADAGVAVICLAVAIVCAIFAYQQIKGNNALEQEFRERIDADGKAMRDEQASLLREMLESEKASRESILESNKNIENFESTINRLCEQNNETKLSLETLKQSIETKLDLLINQSRRSNQ